MGKNLTGIQKSTIVLKAMQHYDFKRRRMMDGCMKPFLTRLRSEMKISIDERTVTRLLQTMKEQEDSDKTTHKDRHSERLGESWQ